MTSQPCSHPFFLGLFAFFAAPVVCYAGIIVNENSIWPSSPFIETFERTAANVESERDARFNRDLTQTFQVPSPFQLDKIFIDYNEGIAGKEVTLHLYPVADVQASGTTITPSGADLLGGGSGLIYTTTASINAGNPSSSDPFAVLEFDLTGSDEVMLAASTGTEGYAFQIVRTGTGSDVDDTLERSFKWFYNDNDDRYALGRSAAVGGGPDDSGDDFLMALKAVPEPSTIALGMLAVSAMIAVRRRRAA